MSDPQTSNDPPENYQRPSLAREFIIFLKENKKWWLLPIVLVIFLLTVLAFLGSNPVTAPFIYTLF